MKLLTVDFELVSVPRPPSDLDRDLALDSFRRFPQPARIGLFAERREARELDPQIVAVILDVGPRLRS